MRFSIGLSSIKSSLCLFLVLSCWILFLHLDPFLHLLFHLLYLSYYGCSSWSNYFF